MRRENLVAVFLKRHIPLLVCLALLLVLPVGALLFVFTNAFQSADRIGDFSAWTSLVAGIMTYVSAALLGVAVYYHTWSGQYREEMLSYSAELVPVYRGEFHNFFVPDDFPAAEKQFFYEYVDPEEGPASREYSFKRLVVKNYNSHYPQSIYVAKVELSVDGAPFVDCTGKLLLVTSFDLDETVDDRLPRTVLVGIHDSFLEEWHREALFHTHTLRLLLRLSNDKHTEYVQITTENDSLITNHPLSKREEKALVLPTLQINRILTKESIQ